MFSVQMIACVFVAIVAGCVVYCVVTASCFMYFVCFVYIIRIVLLSVFCLHWSAVLNCSVQFLLLFHQCFNSFLCVFAYVVLCVLFVFFNCCILSLSALLVLYCLLLRCIVLSCFCCRRCCCNVCVALRLVCSAFILRLLFDIELFCGLLCFLCLCCLLLVRYFRQLL